VITGSDAHQAHLVGHGFAEVDEWIAASPALRRVRYRGRRPLRPEAETLQPESAARARRS